MNPSSGPSSTGERYGFFMLQTRTTGTPGIPVTVVLEDLGTGEKHRFETAEALGTFLNDWGRAPASGRNR